MRNGGDDLDGVDGATAAFGGMPCRPRAATAFVCGGQMKWGAIYDRPGEMILPRGRAAGEQR